MSAPSSIEITPSSMREQRSLPRMSARLSRRKSSAVTNALDTNLRRCLTTFDITLLALGHMIGEGVYVITATVAKNVAGPAIVLSFLLSAIASFLSALCYAELGVRYPKAGSAYSYTYVALGEISAFMIGWNMVLEYVIGAAATARACSAYIDSLAGSVIRTTIMNHTRVLSEELSVEYFDVFAFAILIFVVIFLSFGVKSTSYINNVFSIVNVIVIFIIIGVGAYFSDLTNWTNPDSGGFMPYGWSGVFGASATCFYAFIGFDSIASAGEEAKVPQKAIPRATLLSMVIAFLSYMGVSSVLTLMVNYKDITGPSGLPDAFGSHGAKWAEIVIVVGAVSGMITAIVGTIFALTRVVYGMAEDGLLLKCCSRVNSKTKTPLCTMYFFTIFSGVMALILDINSLVEVMSIGALIAYLVVSVSVIILRYTPTKPLKPAGQELETIGETLRSTFIEDQTGKLMERFQFLRRFKPLSQKMWPQALACYVISTIILCGFTRGCSEQIAEGRWWAILVFVCLVVCLLLSFLFILMHKQSNEILLYKMPFFPLLPALSILLNTVLIVNLHLLTWIRLLIWMVVGLAIYFTYGMEHSKEDLIMRIPESLAPDDRDPRRFKKPKFSRRAKTPTVSAAQSREFLFTSLDPIP